MAVISLCGSVGGNTGQIKCDTSRGNPKVAIVGGGSYDASKYATSAAFKAALLADMKLAKGNSSKMYPFPEIQGVTVNTEANKEGTTGYGTKFVLLEGRPAYTFDIITGVNTEKELRKFNKHTVPVFIFDDAGNVWGKIDSQGNFTGTNAQIFVTGSPFGDANNLSLAKVTISFQSAAEFYDYAAFVSTDFNTSDLEGLLDVQLSEIKPHVSNAYYIQGVVKNASLGNDINMHGTYSAEIANGALWYAKTGPSFATVLPITSVADDPTDGGWTVTLDTTAFGALTSGAAIKIGWADPGTLDTTGNVTGVEAVPVIVLK